MKRKLFNDKSHENNKTKKICEESKKKNMAKRKQFISLTRLEGFF